MTRSTGIPTWIDLGTTDLEGVKPFYVELFGWNFEDAGEQFGHYNMITKEGGLVGGAMDLNHLPGAAPDNQPSTWDVFLAVDDVEKRHALALQQGASSLFGPSEVGPAGRCATVADPTGATVAMWQAGDTEGYSFTGRPGTPIWFELVTTDMAAASAFYTEVFEFNHVAMDDDYATNGPVDEATSGMMRSEDGASYWQITVAVSDIAAALDRTTELGGQLVKAPADSPWGPFATIADPQGARLLVMQPPANAS